MCLVGGRAIGKGVLWDAAVVQGGGVGNRRGV